MSEPSESEMPSEMEAAPSGLLQKLRTAKWSSGLRQHLAQEIAFTSPPGVEHGGANDLDGDDADGDGD